MQSMIRWTKDDKINLQKAVNNFNAKIRRLKKKGYTNLPNMVSYEEYRGWKDLQDNEYSQEIFSRNELNRVMKSLTSFTKRGSELKIKLPSGQEMTRWEYNELKKQRTKARRLLTKNISSQEWVEQFGMGSGESKITKKLLNDINNLENIKGYDLNILKQRLGSLSRKDRDILKAEIYRRNFMYAIEDLEGYDNVELLKDKLKSIKNPIAFYEFVKDSELSELFKYYKSKGSDVVLAGFNNSQEAFNYGLETLGLL